MCDLNPVLRKRIRNDYMVEHAKSQDSFMMQYFIEPHYDQILSSAFHKTRYLVKLLVGHTGTGKTYGVFNYIIPSLFSMNDLDLVMYTAPQTEILSKIDATKSAGISTKAVMFQNPQPNELYTLNRPVVTYVDKLDGIKDLLDAGQKVLYVGTNQSIVSKNGRRFMKELQGLGYNVGWFIDEIMAHLISDPRNYADVNGSTPYNYKALMFAEAELFSSWSPDLWGMTATPTGEQTGLIRPYGKLRYKIINEVPNLEEMYERGPWVGQIKRFDIYDSNAVKTAFNESLFDLLQTSTKTGNKHVFYLQAEREGGRNGWQIPAILDLIDNFVQDFGHYKSIVPHLESLDNNDPFIAVLTSEEKGFRTIDGYPLPIHETRDERQKQDIILKALNDPDHPCTILLGIEKGKMGMNIAPLTRFMSFRHTEKKRTQKYGGEIITDMGEQIVGRLQRIYTGLSKKEFEDKYDYKMSNYARECSDEEASHLLKDNSINLCVPDNKYWDSIIDEVCQRTPTVQQANAWLMNLRAGII